MDPITADNRRRIDLYIERYAQNNKNPINKMLHLVSLSLMIFSLFGLTWAIPFPYLSFLGRYNGFVNWASFLIAFTVYYYYTLSPVFSYVMLLVIFVFSGLIVSIEKLHIHHNWPTMWLICLFIFVLGYLVQLIAQKIEGKKRFFLIDFKSLTIGPIWAAHLLFKKLGLKY